MKFTREQVIEMAREAGFDVSRDGHAYSDGCASMHIDARLERFATLAADAALEAAALECEKYDSLRIDGAGETIRAMKEKP